MKFNNFLETDKREGGLLTFFLWKGGGGLIGERGFNRGFTVLYSHVYAVPHSRS